MGKIFMKLGCVGVLVAAMTAQPVAAQQMCGQRTAVLERLANFYGETRRSMGLGGNNGVVEVFASEETRTWTITITMPDGRMCLLASGNFFEDAIDPLKTARQGA